MELIVYVSYSYADFWWHPNYSVVMAILNHIARYGYEGWVDG